VKKGSILEEEEPWLTLSRRQLSATSSRPGRVPPAEPE
jgi:hypothetical protein